MSKRGRRGLSVQNRSSMSWKSAVSSDALSLSSGLNYSSAPLQWTPFLLGMTSIQYTYRFLMSWYRLGTFCNPLPKPSRCAVLLPNLPVTGVQPLWQFTVGSAPSLTHFLLFMNWGKGLPQLQIQSTGDFKTEASFSCWNLPSCLRCRYKCTTFVSPGKTSLVLSFIPHRPPF